MTGRNVARFVRQLDARGPRTAAGCVVALALWFAFVSAFVAGLSEHAEPMRPLTLDARLVEIVPAAPVSKPAALARPAPNIAAPSRPARMARPVNRPAAAVPARMPSHTGSALPSPATAPPIAPTTHANAEEPPAALASSSPHAAVSGDTTARPIVQPLPVLPDDLREYTYRAVALARFTIHPDGSVDVVLVKSTPNPRLNQLLLEALRNWRFSPAIKEGHPIESEQDIRVHFNVE
ncbi:TonB family protein [Paraburkholderia sp. J76]|uniref:TonB family protein n=1 Tax=Paraburkholderia sp. J76 TaxID=2805439 RepID=UPI002ABD622D|nr:TonB family protein [Paraburkholderia sp. J76]